MPPKYFETAQDEEAPEHHASSTSSKLPDADTSWIKEAKTLATLAFPVVIQCSAQQVRQLTSRPALGCPSYSDLPTGMVAKIRYSQSSCTVLCA